MIGFHLLAKRKVKECEITYHHHGQYYKHRDDTYQVKSFIEIHKND